MTDKRARRYTEARTAVREVVNRIDPIGLLRAGAPEDEYEPQVGDLVRLVMRPDRFTEQDVDAIWRRSFGDDYAASHLSEQMLQLQRLQSRFGTSA